MNPIHMLREAQRLSRQIIGPFFGEERQINVSAAKAEIRILSGVFGQVSDTLEKDPRDFVVREFQPAFETRRAFPPYPARTTATVLWSIG